MKPRFEWLDHTGDVGIRVYGRDLREIFVYATKALREALVSGEGRRQKKPLVLDLFSDSSEILLLHFLKEILYFFETQKGLPLRLDIKKLEENHIVADVWTDLFDPRYHVLKTEIKAVTYHQLSVQKVGEGYRAEVIFDV